MVFPARAPAAAVRVQGGIPSCQGAPRHTRRARRHGFRRGSGRCCVAAERSFAAAQPQTRQEITQGRSGAAAAGSRQRDRLHGRCGNRDGRARANTTSFRTQPIRTSTRSTLRAIESGGRRCRCGDGSDSGVHGSEPGERVGCRTCRDPIARQPGRDAPRDTGQQARRRGGGAAAAAGTVAHRGGDRDPSPLRLSPPTGPASGLSVSPASGGRGGEATRRGALLPAPGRWIRSPPGRPPAARERTPEGENATNTPR